MVPSCHPLLYLWMTPSKSRHKIGLSGIAFHLRLPFEACDLLLHHCHHIAPISTIADVVAPTTMAIEWKHHEDEASLALANWCITIEQFVDRTRELVHRLDVFWLDRCVSYHVVALFHLN